jgi:hypothetical protein
VGAANDVAPEAATVSIPNTTGRLADGDDCCKSINSEAAERYSLPRRRPSVAPTLREPNRSAQVEGPLDRLDVRYANAFFTLSVGDQARQRVVIRNALSIETLSRPYVLSTINTGSDPNREGRVVPYPHRIAAPAACQQGACYQHCGRPSHSRHDPRLAVRPVFIRRPTVGGTRLRSYSPRCRNGLRATAERGSPVVSARDRHADGVSVDNGVAREDTKGSRSVSATNLVRTPSRAARLAVDAP